jgi:hypothetical protein
MTKAGLTARSLLLPGYFYGGDEQLGTYMKEVLRTDPYWIEQRKIFEEP